MNGHDPASALDQMMPKGTPVDLTQALDLSNLKEKPVIVTGGASGIGLACATRVAEAGGYVTIADLQSEVGTVGTAAAQQLSSKGLKVQFVQCDLASYESQVTAFQTAVRFGNRLDLLIPCAGIVAQKNLFEMAADTKPSVDTAPPAPGFSVVEVNLKGVYYSCYLAMHYFQLPRTVNNTFQKSIVLIASLSAYTGYKLSSTYSISKFGVRGLFYSIREAGAALSPSVRVNLVAPTFLDTPMVTGAGMIDHPVVKLIGIVPMRPVVDVIMRVAADESVQGRAVACMADGSKDLGDELRTGFAGAEAQKLVVGAMAEGMKKMIVEAQGQAA